MTSHTDWELARSETLDGGQIAAVQDLSDAVERVDGAPPLDEHAELRLFRAHEGTEHLLIRRDQSVLGYAQLQNLQTDEDVAAEILVGLDDRSVIAAALFDAAEDVVGTRPLSVWARGESTPVRAEADARGYDPRRTLLTMARSLTDLASLRTAATQTSRLPDGVVIRAFVPGQDDTAWLGVNARSFARHREQGRWTQADLDDRIAQPWFDPAGFLLLVDHGGDTRAAGGDTRAPGGDPPAGTVIGFHWTKLHASPSDAADTHDEPPVAEVYVIGLDPSAQGRKLSQPLLIAGLEHLQTTGAETVILYVDEENAGAVRLYERTGFEITRRQTQFHRPLSSPSLLAQRS